MSHEANGTAARSLARIMRPPWPAVWAWRSPPPPRRSFPDPAMPGLSFRQTTQPPPTRQGQEGRVVSYPFIQQDRCLASRLAMKPRDRSTCRTSVCFIRGVLDHADSVSKLCPAPLGPLGQRAGPRSPARPLEQRATGTAAPQPAAYLGYVL